jgi:glycosyltransferase involved in cell wall biosynthesis
MKNKSILFINQSSGYLMVDIINAHVPHYDNIVLLTGYLNPRETLLDEKVKVKKLLNYVRTSSPMRLFTWIGFWLLSLYYVFVKYRKYKVYFVSNPPLNVFTARWIKREFAFLIYDVYPNTLSNQNIISNKSIFFKYWEKTNQIVYRKSTSLFTVSDSMKTSLTITKTYQDKLNVVPIWTNNTFFKTINPNDNKFIQKFKLQNKFIVSYSGNLGRTHPVEKLIDLAEMMKNEKDILFLIIGEGDKKHHLLQLQKSLNLPNLKILDLQPTEIFPHVLAAVDIGVVTLESNSSNLSVPSKTFNLMSVGKPILSISKPTSELAQIVVDNKIGENFNEQDLHKMRDFILKLKNDDEAYQCMQNCSKKTSLKFSPENAKQMILN